MTETNFDSSVRALRSVVIGVGNAYRSDDGVGVAVARRIQQRDPSLRVLEASGEGAQLMDVWQNAHEAFVIDAVRSGSTPGTVYRLDAAHDIIPSEFFHYSTHAFSVAEAVELARALDCLPSRLVIYGIEGKCFDAGEQMSPEVLASIDDVTERILAELHLENPSHGSNGKEITHA